MLSYVAHKPHELSNHLELIRSIDANYLRKDVEAAASKVLSQLALEASVGFRSQFFLDEEQTPTFHRFAERSSQVRVRLAQLYAMGAVDALEKNQRTAAKTFLEHSKELHSGLKVQQLVQGHLAPRNPVVPIDDATTARARLNEQPSAAPEPAAPAAEEGGLGLFGDGSELAAKSQSAAEPTKKRRCKF